MEGEGEGEGEDEGWRMKDGGRGRRAEEYSRGLRD